MIKEVEAKYKSYPPAVKKEMLALRKIVLEIAKKDKDIDFIDEALKWGEPSFMTKSSGSTLRIDWKEKSPESISVFVNCKTKLILMFKELYPHDFEYLGNREIRLPLKEKYSKTKLKKCFELVLKYNLMKDSF